MAKQGWHRGAVPIPKELRERIVDRIAENNCTLRVIAREMGVCDSTVSALNRFGVAAMGARTSMGAPDEPELLLWAAVIRRAKDDLEIADHFAGRADVMEAAAEIDIKTRQQALRVRREATEDGDHPRVFFRSTWFVDICHITGANPDKILAGLRAEGVPV